MEVTGRDCDRRGGSKQDAVVSLEIVREFVAVPTQAPGRGLQNVYTSQRRTHITPARQGIGLRGASVKFEPSVRSLGEDVTLEMPVEVTGKEGGAAMKSMQEVAEQLLPAKGKLFYGALMSINEASMDIAPRYPRLQEQTVANDCLKQERMKEEFKV
eukprot:1133438-Pelagomonas_calceolata.AAC.7